MCTYVHTLVTKCYITRSVGFTPYVSAKLYSQTGKFNLDVYLLTSVLQVTTKLSLHTFSWSCNWVIYSVDLTFLNYVERLTFLEKRRHVFRPHNAYSGNSKWIKCTFPWSFLYISTDIRISQPLNDQILSMMVHSYQNHVKVHLDLFLTRFTPIRIMPKCT